MVVGVPEVINKNHWYDSIPKSGNHSVDMSQIEVFV